MADRPISPGDLSGAVLVVQMPEAAAGDLPGLRTYVVESLDRGVLVLPLGTKWSVEMMPRLGGVLIQGDPAPAAGAAQSAGELRSPGAEKAAILAKLKAYREQYGLGCLDELAGRCGKAISADILRGVLLGSIKLSVQDWRRIGRALDKLAPEVTPGE